MPQPRIAAAAAVANMKVVVAAEEGNREPMNPAWDQTKSGGASGLCRFGVVR
jgi:hypothetical protein